ncbi:MAG: BlaI/MecI/CopY family transcriptional regulator [Planctomycetota bacterium]
MARTAKQGPTDGEIAILQVLWEQGPSTVRQVHERLNDDRETGYTTVLKFMQIMFEKGLLKRDESHHAHIYKAAVTRKNTQRKTITRVAEQLFDGSAQQLVLQALSSKKSSPEELAEIRRLLDELEGDTK